MKLYSYYRSSSAWRVRIALAYKRVAYEYIAVDLSPETLGQGSPSYASINPMRQVPTLEWAENGSVVRLTQSVAITEYLEETHPDPALLPRDPVLRAYVRRAVEIVNSGVQPLQNSMTLAAVRRIGSDGDVVRWTDDAMTRGLVALELYAQEVGGTYCIGDEPSLADVFLVPQLYNARRFGVDLDRYPTLLDIERKLSALPAFSAAHPDVQPDARRAHAAGKAQA
jgi:maleylpyruvate isomerase